MHPERKITVSAGFLKTHAQNSPQICLSIYNSIYLLIKGIEQFAGKEFAKRDIKSVAKLFDKVNSDFLSFWIKHTVNA